MEDPDLLSVADARRLLGAAAAAAPALAALSQEEIDAILDAMQRAALPNAGKWAKLAVEETGFGNAVDKTAKNLFATEQVYRFIRSMRTVGILSEDLDRRVLEIAAPAGVVAAIIPSTNPTSTAINKIFIALKAACPIVLSPHPNARRSVMEVSRVLADAARIAGAPEGAIGCMTHVALEGTRELMRHRLTAIILATGGTGLVRAAYSSGKPAYGVGPGNVPAYVDRSADVLKAARDIVAGKTFDNGVLCSSENAVIADEPIHEALIAAMSAHGSLFLNERQTRALSACAVTPAGALNPEIVGKDALTIARLAGIDAPAGTKCLVARLTKVGPEAPLSREKLSPILAFYVEDGWEAACARCLEILAYGGMGHTMSIHARDREVILRFALGKPVFRIIVNSPAAVGAVGLTTGIDPSMTLGCGALGGNITSDNITPRHLVNVKRLAFEIMPFAKRSDAPIHALSFDITAPAPARAKGDSPSAAEGRSARVADVTPVRSGLREGRISGDALKARIFSALQATGILVQSGPAPPATPAAPPEARPRADHTARDTSPAAAAPTPVPFVSEADVREALKDNRRITIGARTIVTPSARDLGTAHRVFIET